MNRIEKLTEAKKELVIATRELRAAMQDRTKAWRKVERLAGWKVARKTSRTA